MIKVVKKGSKRGKIGEKHRFSVPHFRHARVGRGPEKHCFLLFLDPFGKRIYTTEMLDIVQNDGFLHKNHSFFSGFFDGKKEVFFWKISICVKYMFLYRDSVY